MFSKILVNFLSNSMKSGQKLSAFIVILLCLPSVLQAQNLIVYPCLDIGAIRWVRDSTFCDQYYICHFGQPLVMPSCPSGQVWSNRALNCVPRNSRWDDCLSPVNTISNDKQSTFENKLTTTEQKTHFISSESTPTKSNIVISIQQLTRSPTPSVTRSELVLPQDKMKVTRTEEAMTSLEPQPLEAVSKNWYEIKQPNPIWHDRGYLVEPTAPTTVFTSEHQGTSTSAPLLLQEKQDRHKVWFGEKSSFLQRLNVTAQRVKIDPDHECFRHPEALLPHSENCHWYINCSLANLDDLVNHTRDGADEDDGVKDGVTFTLMQPFRVRQAGVFVWECRYPQLFDDVTGRCREFMNVDCRSRFQAVDQCEYSSRQCNGARCVPCDRRYGRCRGRENGVYPLHPSRWTPLFVTCYQERNIAQDECSPPTPIFSPELMDCVSLFEVPKQQGGFLPDCSTRLDGYYPDEQGRCAIFFRCSLGHFRGYDECPPGSVFDPAIPACQPYSHASKPCGEGQSPLCGGKLDGLYADPYGRCTTYFECKQGVFHQYFTCDLGIFDPLTQRCVLAAELTVRPCGLQPSPCEALPTGVYPDQETGCQHFIECHHGIMITNGTCDRGTIFSAITGRCDLPQHTPPPCGVSTVCSGRPDGRYPALSRGCSFYYECFHGEFVSLRRCTEEDGGIFFNMETGNCDYPQNICPPCGYRWWGCPRTYETQSKSERN